MTGRDNKVLIKRSEQFISEYNKYKSDSSFAPLRDYFKNRNFLIKDTELTYRILNHWSEYGLLDDHREKDGKAWRYFSTPDLAWIRVLMQLREIGFPLEKLLRLYEYTFSHDKDKRSYIFEYGILKAMRGAQIYLIILPESGYLEVVDEIDLILNLVSGELGKHHYLNIHLNKCLAGIKPDANYIADVADSEIGSNLTDIEGITEIEQKILDAIRTNRNTEITVSKKGELIDSISKKTKKVFTPEDLNELVNNMRFGEVCIKVENRKVVFVETTVNEKT